MPRSSPIATMSPFVMAVAENMYDSCGKLRSSHNTAIATKCATAARGGNEPLDACWDRFISKVFITVTLHSHYLTVITHRYLASP